MDRNKRVMIDCRDFPNEFGCTLLISGSEKEVLTVALRHSVEEHGHQDTPELKRHLRSLLKKEEIKIKKKFKKRNEK